MRMLFYLYAGMSVATFIIYAIDKFEAKHDMWRTPEKTLHIMELCCGWPGAMLAHKVLRHKSYKKSFRQMFWVMVVLNVIMLMCFLKLVK